MVLPRLSLYLKLAGTSYYSFLLSNVCLASQFPSLSKCPFKSQLYHAACTQHELNKNVINIRTMTTRIHVSGEFQTIPNPLHLKKMEIWEGPRNWPPLFQWYELIKLGLCEEEIIYDACRKQGRIEYLPCRLHPFV